LDNVFVVSTDIGDADDAPHTLCLFIFEAAMFQMRVCGLIWLLQ
jgi:hypothetical protein